MNLPNKKEIEWADNCIRALEAFKKGYSVQMRSGELYGYGIPWEDFDLSEVLRSGNMVHWRPKPVSPKQSLNGSDRKPRSCWKLPVKIPCAVDDETLKEIFGEEKAKHMSGLAPLLRAILILRFGEKPKTLKKVGMLTGGRSGEQVRRLQNQALGIIRTSIRKENHLNADTTS